jgi:hypothetical protein
MAKFLLRLTCGLLTFATSAAVTTVSRDSKTPMTFGPAEAIDFGNEQVYRCHTTPDLPLPIQVLLNRQYPGWSFPEVDDDTCYSVKNCGGADAYAQLIKGDFNDDGRLDYAVLIQQSAEANDKGVAKPWMIRVVAFFRKANGYQMYPVTAEGGGAVILMRKGETDFDYEAQREFTYPRDAILSGWTSYLYEYGRFRAIITVD